MRGAFDELDDRERQSSTGDTELTLSIGTVLLVIVGLIVLCAVCFGAGFVIGHRGDAPAAEAQKSPSPEPQTKSSQSKPSADAQAAPAPGQPAPADSSAQPAASDASHPPAAVAVPVSPAPGAATDTAQPQVRPALPASATTPQPVNAYPSHPAVGAAQPQARSANAQPGVRLWVQIAAVSHVEDAQVLTKALQKHGYSVTPRREADDLIHVRIGPFNSTGEANRWRAQLLDDGYNAEIQQ